MKEIEKDLLKKAKAGDSFAIDEILTSKKNLVMAIARKFFLIGGDRDDLIQEGMIGLFKAINNFDGDKYDNFTAFAIKVIENEIISAIRRASSNNQQLLSDSILFGDDEVLFSDELSPENFFISEESTVELSREINNKLSKFERTVVDYYLKGYSYIDIAGMLNTSNKSIDNALSRIKKKLQYLKERL